MKNNLQMVGVFSVIICLLSTGCLDMIGLGGEEAVGTNQAPSAVVTSDNNVVTLEGGSAFISSMVKIQLIQMGLSNLILGISVMVKLEQVRP